MWLTSRSTGVAMKNFKLTFLLVLPSISFGRWCSYAGNDHGGNAELKTMFEGQRAEYIELPRNKCWTQASHWKDVLMSRTFGYNSN